MLVFLAPDEVRRTELGGAPQWWRHRRVSSLPTHESGSTGSMGWAANLAPLPLFRIKRGLTECYSPQKLQHFDITLSFRHSNNSSQNNSQDSLAVLLAV
eukprot:3139867-Amphidinium_carterae.1